MSSVVIAGDVAGSITLQAPSSAGSAVLTLPATTATLLTDSSGVLNIGSGQVYKDASGNVGIGTTAPSTKLTVAGAITITGAFALRGSYGGGAIVSNFAAGDGALVSNTTGSENTASGAAALFSNTTGHGNTASGVGALYSNTTGYNNTASGMNTLYNNTTGDSNTASGVSALLNNTTGYYNTVSGYVALNDNTTGFQNTASGVSALQSNTTGYNNTASGINALYNNTTGDSNTASGLSSLLNNTTGSGNSAFGTNSGSAITTGSNNVVIGGYDGSATPISATGSNFVVLSDGAGTVRQTHNASGSLAFDTAGTAFGTAGQVLQSNGNAAVPTWVTPDGGTVTSVGGTGTVSGLTLTGTVTSTGSLTLGGTLALGSLNTLGTAAGLSATLIVGSGGTGVTTLTGIPYGNGTSAFTVATAAQLVTAIGASTTLVAGSMSSADKTKLDGVASGATANTGTVTGVTGTAPVVSSGGTAPAISMAAATTSVPGYLTSTDWNTFNGKYSTGGALGTPASGTLTNCTFPTLNQSTTGTASNITAYTINQSVGTANAVQHSDITTSRAAALTTGYMYYGNTGTKYAGFDGTNFVSSMPMSFNILGSSASCTGNAATVTNGVYQNTSPTLTGLSFGANNPHVRLRHLDGKAPGTDTDEILYLNYSNGHAVTVNGYTVIHAGNIGSQSVNYATTAGTANGLNTANTYTVTGLNVGAGANASTITMNDSDQGNRAIHCNGNRVGFLTTANGWGSYCGDAGEWYSDQSIRTPIFYDNNNTAFYIDPNSVTRLLSLTIAGQGISYTGTAAYNGKSSNTIGLTWGANSIWGSVDNSNSMILGTASDYRLKTNVDELGSTLALIQKLRPITYDSVEFDGSLSGSSHAGVLAHELADIIPSLVEGEKDAVNDEGKPIYQSVYYAGFAPYFIKAIQEQQEIITAQQQSISTLTDLITNLTDRISAIENK